MPLHQTQEIPGLADPMEVGRQRLDHQGIMGEGRGRCRRGRAGGPGSAVPPDHCGRGPIRNFCIAAEPPTSGVFFRLGDDLPLWTAQEGGKEAAGIAGLPGQHMFRGRHKVEPGGFGIRGAPLVDRVLE
jgi:hypothetical protein